MNIHEEQFINSFIVAKKRERYLELLSKDKTRGKITRHFDHCADLDDQFVTQIPVNQQNPDEIYKILKKKGAGDTCYIIADNWDLDRKEMNLRTAIDEYYICDGAFFSCIPGKLVFYSGEEENGRYILEKR